MKISINVNPEFDETEIIINCNELSSDIEELIAALRINNQQIAVKKEDQNCLIAVNKILYIESLERKTFVYTENEIYDSKLKLYEMESKLCQMGFLRISKSCLVNLKYIKLIKNDIERKLRLTMQNGEQIIVSRQYADEIKRRLEVL